MNSHLRAPVVLAAALAGLVPAFRMSQLDPVHGLKSAGPTASAGRADRRLLRGVAVLQTALTLALLVGAGLLIRTVNKLARVRLGYDTENILTMNVTDINGPNFFTFHDRTLARISALPGVKQVAFAWGVPLTGNKWMITVKIGGESDSGKFNDALWIPLRSVTPEYFELMGQHVLSGRNFPASHSTETNRAVMPSVAVVNEAMAKRYFPKVNPIGRMLRMPGREDKPIEIIGVVANARTEAVVREPEPEIYFCLWEAFPFTKHLLIRTASNPGPLFITVQRELRAIERHHAGVAVVLDVHRAVAVNIDGGWSFREIELPLGVEHFGMVEERGGALLRGRGHWQAWRRRAFRPGCYRSRISPPPGIPRGRESG